MNMSTEKIIIFILLSFFNFLDFKKMILNNYLVQRKDSPRVLFHMLIDLV